MVAATAPDLRAVTCRERSCRDGVRLPRAHVLGHLPGRGPVEDAARDTLPTLRVGAAASRAAGAGAWQPP